MKKKIIKKITSYIFLFCFTVGLLNAPIDCYADEPGRIPQRYDELESKWYINGDKLVYENYAGQRRSKVAFGSIGCTISRCKPNQKELYNGTATEWISMRLNADFSETTTYDQRTADNVLVLFNHREYDLNSIHQAILDAGYTEWAAEFKRFYIDKVDTDNVVYIRLDFICQTRYYDNLEKNSPYKASGEYNFSTDQIVSGIGYETLYMNNPPNDGKNPNEIRNNAINPNTGGKISWGAVTRSDFDKYYNIYLPADESTPIIAAAGTPKALFETKNFSNIFNVSEAIPSGERVTNNVSASSFTGYLYVGTKTTAPIDYAATYKYVYYTQHLNLEYVGSHQETDYSSGHLVFKGPGHDYLGNGAYLPGRGYYDMEYDTYWVGNGDRDRYGNYDSNGEYEYRWDGTYDENVVDNHTFSYKAYVEYQAINDFDIRIINSMSVYNNALYGGVVSYDSASLSNRNVAVSAIVYSQAAYDRGATYDVLSNGSNLSGYNFTPVGTRHSSMAGSGVISSQTIDVGHNLNATELASRISSDDNSLQNAIANGCSSWNDKFTINDNGTSKTFMDNTSVTGAYISSDGGSCYHLVGQVAASSSHATTSSAVESYVNSLQAARSTAAKNVNIPYSVLNGDYPTGMTATWTSVVGKGDYTLGAGKNFGYTDSIYNHVMNGGVLSAHNGGDPDDGYPIRVHTPVIAPIDIVFYDETPAIENTQLVSSMLNTASNYELLLDKKYYLKFDNEQWYSQLYGVAAGYGTSMDQYVSKKMVRFPFGVVYNGKYYPRTGTGYTVWIEIQAPGSYLTSWEEGIDKTKYESSNHWQMMPFYIPSFADEVGYTGSDAFVEVAVYAYNFSGTPLADDDDTAVVIESSNHLTSEYIATTRKQVQSSGWIYDFSVVGTSNQAIYTGNGMDSTSIYEKMGNLSFAGIKNELKTGTKTRIGTDNVRYLKDGTINNAINVLQTLPLRTGQSFVFNQLGNIWKGQTFGFSIKTISNLNGNNDFIYITPHFKYVKSDGTVLSSEAGDFKLYEVTENNGKMTIDEFTPSNHVLTNGESVYLDDTIFEQAAYDSNDTNAPQQLGNWAQSSANKENLNNGALGYMSTISSREFLKRKTASYNLNTIYIPSSLRYMAGEYEQLEMNDGKVYDRATGTAGLTTYWNTITNYSNATEDLFRYSMQQWQSCYSIPPNTYIVDTRARGGNAFDIFHYIESQSAFSWESSNIVERDKGILIIGFDIVAYRNGVPYLTYEGANNMWLTEGSNPNPSPDPSHDPNPDYDDVVIVDITRSVTDYMEPAIQNIN